MGQSRPPNPAPEPALFPADLPAWFRPSLMASSWLHWLLAEGRRESAHLLGQELQPHAAVSLELCPAVSPPWASQLWALSRVLLRPQKGKGLGGRRGRQLGKRGKGGRGGASISNFIINTLFCKVGACVGFCTQVSGQSFLRAESKRFHPPPHTHTLHSTPASFLLLGGTHFKTLRERSVGPLPSEEQKDNDRRHAHH